MFLLFDIYLYKIFTTLIDVKTFDECYICYICQCCDVTVGYAEEKHCEDASGFCTLLRQDGMYSFIGNKLPKVIRSQYGT